MLDSEIAVDYNEIDIIQGGIHVNTSDVLKELRVKHNLTQDEMAEKLFVTRQAISRWENGETTPNTETLKLISTTFDVSINTLLGSPRTLICQCCGMPLNDDNTISREKDGSFNEEYCKWCYIDGKFVYKNMDELLDYLVEHMSSDEIPPDKTREYFAKLLTKLGHWQKAENKTE